MRLSVAVRKTEISSSGMTVGLAVEAAKKAGISVAVCGEAAARPDMIPVLLGLGVNELSMSPSSVLRAKKIVCEL